MAKRIVFDEEARKTLAVMIPSRKAAKSAKSAPTNHRQCVFLFDKTIKTLLPAPRAFALCHLDFECL